MGLDKVAEELRTNGYAVIENFLSDNEVNDLKQEIKNIIDQTFDSEDNGVNYGNKLFVASAKSQLSADYFMESGDKIRHFYESKAFNEAGELAVDKYESLNKIGHALHWLNPVFRRITFGVKVKDLFRRLNFVDPLVAQSMYIFKNPGIGAEVNPHQDATFLHTIPRISVLGVWIALEDANAENGCLSFAPGSHRFGLRKQWIRNPDREPAMIFTNETDIGLDETFELTPVSKGSCILIDALVLHKSSANQSAKPRPIYTFHVYDRDDTEWDTNNWLQPSSQLPFPSLYNN